MDTGRQFSQTPYVVEHERTYHAFSILVRWSMLVLGDLILWLSLWFASPAGFLGATVVAVVAFVLGYMFLVRHEEKQPLDLWVEGR
jgi:di/tricarboxylate transporter